MNEDRPKLHAKRRLPGKYPAMFETWNYLSMNMGPNRHARRATVVLALREMRRKLK